MSATQQSPISQTTETGSPFLQDGRQWAWNSSTLSPAKTCSRKYYYQVILGWIPRGENVHLLFGSIYASSLELYHRLRANGDDHNSATRDVVLEALTKSWGKLDAAALRDLPGSARNKTREHLIRSIVWYLDEYENDPCETVILADGSPAVELTFKFQLTDEIWLCGHIDRLVRYAGDYYVQDQKTTGSSVGSWYFKRYNPDNQMSLYTLAADVVWKAPVKGVMIDAAQIAVGFTKFERGFTFRTPEQSTEWLHDAEYHIKLTWEAAERGWPMNDTACMNYGGCPYIDVCSKSPQVRTDFLEGGGFEKRDYNPLAVR
jgi:hypothetical protein